MRASRRVRRRPRRDRRLRRIVLAVARVASPQRASRPALSRPSRSPSRRAPPSTASPRLGDALRAASCCGADRRSSSASFRPMRADSIASCIAMTRRRGVRGALAVDGGLERVEHMRPGRSPRRAARTRSRQPRAVGRGPRRVARPRCARSAPRGCQSPRAPRSASAIRPQHPSASIPLMAGAGDKDAKAASRPKSAPPSAAWSARRR